MKIVAFIDAYNRLLIYFSFQCSNPTNVYVLYKTIQPWDVSVSSILTYLERMSYWGKMHTEA